MNSKTTQLKQRAGDLIQSDSAMRAMCTAIGAGVLWHGVTRRGPLSVICTLGGAALVTFGLTGKSLTEWLTPRRACPCPPDGAPSFRDEGIQSAQMPEDEIDEASMESFPASDAPASHHSTVLPEK